MNQLNSNLLKEKYKHLNLKQYEFIIRTIIKHKASHKSKKRNTGLYRTN